MSELTYCDSHSRQEPCDWCEIIRLKKELEAAKEESDSLNGVHKHYLFEKQRAEKAEAENAVLVEAIEKAWKIADDLEPVRPQEANNEIDEIHSILGKALAQISEVGDVTNKEQDNE